MIIFFCFSDDDLNKINLRDPIIFEKLYLEYKNIVYNFIMIKTKGNRDIADEILGQTFHSALESAPKLKNVKNIKAWLIQIAYRRYIDYLRTRYNEEKNLYKLQYDRFDASEPFNDVNAKEEIVLFNLIFDKIPEINKKVLTLKYLEEKSLKEISAILNKSERAIDSLLSRSKKILKKKAKKYKRFFYD